VKKCLIGLCLFLCTHVFALAGDVYPFEHPEQTKRFQQLTSELRCLVCQNQNIADSDSQVAADLRQVVFEKIRHGESNQQIKQYLVERFGDFVLFSPMLTSQTVLLWFAPALIIIIGLLLIVWQMRQRREVG